jgi:hypothetical protein
MFCLEGSAIVAFNRTGYRFCALDRGYVRTGSNAVAPPLDLSWQQWAIGAYWASVGG